MNYEFKPLSVLASLAPAGLTVLELMNLEAATDGALLLISLTGVLEEYTCSGVSFP
jgi:hypothetical protein